MRPWGRCEKVAVCFDEELKGAATDWGKQEERALERPRGFWNLKLRVLSLDSDRRFGGSGKKCRKR